MKDNFDPCLAIVLVYEGGKVNDPRDPGGRTNRGVTQRVYDDFRVLRGLPKRTVYEITNAEVNLIYRAGYWEKIKGDDLPRGLDLAVFDPAVNSGPGRALKWLSSARAKAGTVEGQINAICDTRLSFLRGLGTWSVFGKGWGSRVASVRAKALKMVHGVNAPPILNRKAEAAQTKADNAGKAAGGSIATGAGGSLVHPAATGTDPNIWLIGGVLLIAAGVALYFWWRSNVHHYQAEAFREEAKNA